MKKDLKDLGVRSDRIMTPLEVQTAVSNYKSIKNAMETETGPVGWILIGFGMLMIVLGALDTLIG